MALLIQGGTLVDPAANTMLPADVLVSDGLISAVGPQLPAAGHTILHAEHLCVCPGLIDMHVHLRDPGQTYKEDIASGTAAAAAGGVTTVACMPNTNPVIDTPAGVQYVRQAAQAAGNCRVLPIGAVTMGEAGTALTDLEALSEAGVCAFSDDGVPVMSAALLRQALQLAAKLHKPIISHCEDGTLVDGKAVNEGRISQKLGLPGRPAVAEDLMVARDILLAADTGSHVHIAHVSTAGAVELIRQARQRGIPVTGETCPQYFIFTEDEVLSRGTMAKVNPPLRTEADRQAVLEGVLDGTLSCIVTDHAPHSMEEKSRPLPQAPSGLSGLETSLAACLTYLFRPGYLSLPEVIARMTTAPAAVLGLPYGVLDTGAPADLCVFDPAELWTVDASRFRSKGHNSIFDQRPLQGRVRATLCGGKITFQATDSMVE